MTLILERDMHDYQKRAIITAIKKKQAAIFLGTGLGKTIISLTIIDQLLKRRLIKGALVVSPKRAMLNSWRQEAQVWEHTGYLKFSVLHGSVGAGNAETVRQRGLMRKDANVFLINYEGLLWLSRSLHKSYSRRAMPFDCVFYDESTKMKHSTTERFKKFKPFMHRFKYRYAMTGTPIPNGLMDLFGQMYTIDSGVSLGTTLKSFKDRFFIPPPMNTFGKYTLRKGGKKAISRRVQDRTIVMKKKDYVKLPPIIFNNIKIDLPKKYRKQYDALEKTFFLELEEAEIEAFSKATLSLKLRQFLQGKMYEGEGCDRRTHIIHNEKLQTLKEMVDTSGKDVRIVEGIGNCIMAYNFKFEREDLKSIFPNAPSIDGDTTDAQSEEYIKRWNLKQIPVLLYNPASDPHGLNLQFGGNQILWYSLTWNLEQFLQLVDRLYRQRQDKTVFVHMLLFRKTIDEVVASSLVRKEAEQDNLLEDLKNYQKRNKK